MQKFVLVLVGVLIATAIPCIFAEVELSALASECVESDTKIFKACESAQDLQQLGHCSDMYYEEEASPRDVELNRECAGLKDTFASAQLAEYLRQLKERLNPEQIQFLAEIGY